MNKSFTGINRNERLLILENRLFDFERQFKEYSTKRLTIPEHIYRDFCYNRTEYLNVIQEVVRETEEWIVQVQTSILSNLATYIMDHIPTVEAEKEKKDD